MSALSRSLRIPRSLFVSSALLLLVSWGVSGCAERVVVSAESCAQFATSSGAEDNPVVLRIGEEEMRLDALDALDAQVIEGAKMEHRRKLQELRQEIAARHIQDRLIADEAAKRGLSAEELLHAEVNDKTKPPNDEEIRSFYDAHQDEVEGMPYEAVQGQIIDYLHGESLRERFGVFLKELRGAARVSLNLPEVRVVVEAKGPSKGPADAAVTIVIFSDFECPYCERTIGTMEKLLKAYPGDVRIVFRDFPLPFHKNAPRAHEAARCADQQEKFWVMHDRLFANQRALSEADLRSHAEGIGLEMAGFDACMLKGNAAGVQEDLEAGRLVGVSGTPAFFVNGIMLSGAQPFEAFQSVVDRELERRP